ncbi:MAG: hypothetical protein EOP67_29680 [Sphingomonas sp.]|nr:MAG: hypothetical protein EOP67_29680 [Sphingomonas sp.]
MDQPLPALDELLDQVRATRTIDLAMLERAVGATLRETDDSNDSVVFYSAQGVRSGSYTLDLDFRTPVKGGDATSGALLVLDLSGPCVHRAEIEARYGRLNLSQAPRGESLDEEASWSHREPWGELSFGFTERKPDCLRSVVFALSKRG